MRTGRRGECKDKAKGGVGLSSCSGDLVGWSPRLHERGTDRVCRGLPGLYHLPQGKEPRVYNTRLHLRVLHCGIGSRVFFVGSNESPKCVEHSGSDREGSARPCAEQVRPFWTWAKF